MIVLNDNGNNYILHVIEGVEWHTVRRSTPSKLTFSVLANDKYKLREGAQVTFVHNDVKIFKGYIFTINYDNSDVIKVTAYDQLRYLKNKDTYVYQNKTASQVINMIASDFGLQVGEIENTPVSIPSRIEDNQTLFDIIETALDLTMISTKDTYVFYDDYGKLTLKSLGNMMLKDVAITDNNAGEYEYSTSIDGETYNQIKLYFDNSATGKRDIYIEKDSNNIGKWGTLQYYERINEGEDGKSKAQSLLKLYNTPERRLTLNHIIGDVMVRAGNLVLVNLTVGNKSLSNYMLVEACTHHFNKDEHYINVEVRGGALNE